MPGICCYVTTVTRYKLSRSQLSAPICRRCSSLGWFVPLLNIQPIQWVSSKVRSLISRWFIGFKVHWALSWLQPTPPKNPQTLQTSHFFPWSSNTVNDAPLRREQCPESSMCKGKKKKEEHHMHSLPNKTMKRAHWKARSYFGREKKKKTCWMWNSGSACVCVEVIWPDGVRVKESVVTCNSSMTPVWGFKIHTPGSWIEPAADLSPV